MPVVWNATVQRCIGVTLGATLLLAPTLIPGQQPAAGPTPARALLVLSKADQTLAIVDPTTLAVVARVSVRPDPHEVIAAPDGRMAYVSNYGSGAYHTLTPVDLVRQEVLPVIDLGALAGPHGLAVAGGKIWFTAEGAKAIGRYDPEAHTVDRVLATGQERTHILVVSGDGKRVVTSNVNSATVTVAEARTVTPPDSAVPRTEWLQTAIPVDRGPEGIDVSPDGHDAWVANARDGTISVIDLDHKRLRATLAVDVKGANRLKFTPDGKLVFVSTLSGPEVTVLRSLTGGVVKRVPVGRGAAGIVIQPDGARAYVACTPDDSVAVIDVRSLTVVGRIGAGGRPDGLAWAERP